MATIAILKIIYNIATIVILKIIYNMASTNNNLNFKSYRQDYPPFSLTRSYTGSAI